MLIYENNENESLCSTCGGVGGRCCKHCGCAYFVSDIESFKIEEIEKMLASGYVSIIANIGFNTLKNGTLVLECVLTLRARNTGKGEIDLFSTPNVCQALEGSKCHFNWDERPSGGKILIPRIDGNCYTDPKFNEQEEINRFLPYQNILKKIVKKHTGMSVDAKLKEDIKNVFIELMKASPEEMSSPKFAMVISMLPWLTRYFIKELREAKEIVDKNKPVVLTLKKRNLGGLNNDRI